MNKYNPIKRDIIAIRQATRYHRDQKGDDRCWVDDYLVWKFLPDTPPEPTRPPSFEQAMGCCRSFYDNRRAEQPDHVPTNVVSNPALWDADLDTLSEAELVAELERIHKAIRTHRDVVGRERTLDDDRALYEVLPEKIPADFRLPGKPEFLEGVKPGCGCPNFWKSHEKCATNNHNLHQWGPCP
jgi:hypothetical protein